MMLPRCCSILILGMIFLAGCAKPRPSGSVLDATLKKDLPQHLSISSKAYQYSPIHEVLGTTLPEGSYQVDIQCSVRAKEPLYILVNPSRKLDERLPVAIREKIEGWVGLAQWCSDNAYRRGPDAVRLNSFLVGVVTAGAEKELWVKVVAQPRGKDWLVNVVEGEPQAVFADARPRFAFDSRVLLEGSDEQQRNVAEVAAAYTKAEKESAAVRGLTPQVVALRKQERGLAELYENLASAKIAKLYQEQIEVMHEHERRLEQINRDTGSLRDDYKTRDRLVGVESSHWENYRAHDYNPKLLALQQEEQESKERAHQEIEKKISELASQSGIDASALTEGELASARDK